MYDTKNLAANIRKYRKMHGLTQSQLAQKVFVTSQNVSKWELGVSMPDVNNLCKISEILSISVDKLLCAGEDENLGNAMIAIDGGGTKTEFVMFTESGRIVDRIILSGTNPNSCGMENAQSVLKKGIDMLLTKNSNVTSIFAGISGCGVNKNKKIVSSFLQRVYPNIKNVVQTDILNVIYSVPNTDKCIAAISGTGSAVFAKDDDNLYRVGGWGYLFDKGGSGYDIGNDAICACLAYGDGIGEPTLINTLCEKRLDGRVHDKLDQLYTSGKEYIASFAGIVFEAYNQGDKIAVEIIDKNMTRLAYLINSAYNKYKCSKRVVMSGGVTNHREILQKHLISKLENGLFVEFCDMPQIYGAAVGAYKIVGTIPEEFKNNFEEDYKKFLEVK